MAVEFIDEDSVVSLKDIIEEEQELQDTANAVLGDSDDTNCTYPKGYISRQAIYACNTCSGTNTSLPAGICLACSLHCHEGHDLFELYTKRHFRCDCGNSRFPVETLCKLYPDKDSDNKENQYNHNFNGLYCTCNRPYPDDEDEIEDEMIQCLVCEDWYHTRHLGVHPPESYEEMICDQCMSHLPFLRVYQIHSVTDNYCTNDTSINVSIDEMNTTLKAETSTTPKAETSATPKAETSTTPKAETSTTPKAETSTTPKAETSTTPKTETSTTPKAETSTNNDDTALNHLTNSQNCTVEKRSQLIADHDLIGPAYFLSNWRKELCDCTNCIKLYKELNVQYITDVMDTVKSYEERADETKYIHEAGLDALGSTMDHVQQVEVIHGYNQMKEELSKFLKSFANSGKVVRSRDIDDFFGQLQNQKRRRLELGEGIPPDNCR